MGNPAPPDRRFDKPALESVVDLINRSNKTYIKPGEIEVVDVVPILDGADQLYNSFIDIRLADSDEDAPVARMTYGRLDIGDFVSHPVIFRYNGLGDSNTLLSQLRLRHHILLDESDCTIVIGEPDSDGLRTITFKPKTDHMVWTGELVVVGAPDGHIASEISETTMNGFNLEQLTTDAGGT